MTVDLYILIVCSIITAILGLFVYVRSPSQTTNRQIALLSFAIISWIVFNFLSEESKHHSLLYTRLTFFSGIGTSYIMLKFMANFPNKNILKRSIYFRFQTFFTLV